MRCSKSCLRCMIRALEYVEHVSLACLGVDTCTMSSGYAKQCCEQEAPSLFLTLICLAHVSTDGQVVSSRSNYPLALAMLKRRLIRARQHNLRRLCEGC